MAWWVKCLLDTHIKTTTKKKAYLTPEEGEGEGDDCWGLAD